MTENEISRCIVEAAINIHKSTGPGLLESVYEELMDYELSRTYGLSTTRQQSLPLIYKETHMKIGFVADIIVEGKVIIELKSIEELNAVHFKQLLTYLRITDIRLGMLLNFNEALMKDGIHRIVNKL